MYFDLSEILFALERIHFAPQPTSTSQKNS